MTDIAPVAIITGASKGIGAAIARRLAGEGWQLGLCARGQADLEAIAADLRVGGALVYAETADVTVPADVERFVGAVERQFGRIDALVSNAGGATAGRFATLTDVDWAHDIDLKLMAQIRVIRHVLPAMRQRGAGRVVCINAVQAHRPDPAFFAASVTRAGALGLTRTLALELAPDNVLVNSVNVGYIETPQWDRIRQRVAPDASLQDFQASLADGVVPLGRFGQAAEVAGAVAFLLGPDGGYITGASLDVSGGLGV